MIVVERCIQPELLPHAPAELTRGRLRRLGEGIGKVVYASEHWVVKRERSPSEILALIAIWRAARRCEHLLPGRFARTLLEKPSRQLRFLRVLVHAFLLVAPKSAWYSNHLGAIWRTYHKRAKAGEKLSRRYLAGTPLVPASITFPPTWVNVGGWPGWLCVSEATERVEATLHQRLADAARESRFDELETWLDRFLELRKSGWERGLFSTDAHLKNFGVVADRIVLLDPGGLTDKWRDIEERLSFEEVVTEPHIQLGLGAVLGSRPDIAWRFNAKWKELVTRKGVLSHWPAAESLRNAS
jgi:hypothetical protein